MAKTQCDYRKVNTALACKRDIMQNKNNHNNNGKTLK